MKHYYFHHIRVGDFEIPKDLFNSIVELATHPDKDGNRRFILHTAASDDDPGTIYYYFWSRNSDFFYFGYVSED